MRNFITAIYFTIFITLFAFHAEKAEALEIVSSIKPVHSLVLGITKNTPNKAYLLLEGHESPHGYALRPSDMKKLSHSDIVFLISYNLEAFLEKPLQSLDKKIAIEQLINSKNLSLLKNREIFSESHDENEEEEHHDHGKIDPHIWLNPDNAIAMTDSIVEILSEKDPANAKIFLANGKALKEKIRQAAKEIDEKLNPYKSYKFIVMHDGYQYFENYYKLAGGGYFLSQSAEGFGAKRLSKIEAAAKDKSVKCFFGERELNSTSLEAVGKNLKINVGLLDNIGIAQKADENAYINTLQSLADNLIGCFEK